MSLPDSSLGSLTDRELLLLIYGEVNAIAKAQTDIEARVRILEAANNQSIGRIAATGGGSGAIGGGVAVLLLRLMEWF
ncbi:MULTISPECIES: hypothetical protein [unclassified Methanoculleus]|uniref:hypothetical protein n=1 Tax=unclassified Methanoculleus TaxID=2619537 RepID=UPI0025F37704|nr:MULTISPECIES: hypothetical protein [unclassified Methanoculleus]